MQPKNNKQQYFIPLAIIIAGALIGGGVFLGGKSSQGTVTGIQDTAPANTISMNPVSSSDHILGNPNAKVFIVEYSDTECPYCKLFQPTLHKIIDAYGKDGSVAWVYRHFPIPQLHSKAPKEAEATECANELGGPDIFWKYLDQVYDRTNSNNSLDPAQLPQIASDLGLDVTKFNNCLSSGKYTALVEADRQDAIRAGGQGTPYTVLVSGDVKVPITEGAIQYNDLKSRIDTLLNR